MSSADKLKLKESEKEIDKKVLSALQYLHPYVKHRLYFVECKEGLSRNFYNSTGVIDDAIIEVYSVANKDASSSEIKLHLFREVDTRIELLRKNARAHSEDENSDDFLKGELQSLEVNYFVDADLETVLYRDLDDISYNQDSFADSSANKQVLDCLSIHGELYHSESSTVGKFYNWLPEQISNIIDLHMFGKLNASEIAQLKGLDEKKVNELLTSIPQKFREHMSH